MKLDNESLNLLSYCILSKMEELANVKYVSPEWKKTVDKELLKLQTLHSKVCEDIQDSEESKPLNTAKLSQLN